MAIRTMYHYRINQFMVESDIALPCDYKADFDGSNNHSCQICVRSSHSDLDEFPCVYWTGRRLGGQMLRAYDVGAGVLVCFDESVRMFIDRSGNSIHLRFDAVDPQQCALASACAVNLGLSICTLFQDQIPLHGASLELDNKFISLVAPSGTGKSTLLWALLDQGARFGCDDVTPVYREGGPVMAVPSISLPAKLGLREIEGRGLCRQDYQEVLPGQGEYWIPISSENRELELQPLSAIFVLQPFDGPEPPGTVQVLRTQGAIALSALLENTQGLWAVYGMLDPKGLFARYKQIITTVPLYILRYHRHPGMVSRLAHVVRQVLNDGARGLMVQE